VGSGAERGGWPQHGGDSSGLRSRRNNGGGGVPDSMCEEPGSGEEEREWGNGGSGVERGGSGGGDKGFERSGDRRGEWSTYDGVERGERAFEGGDEGAGEARGVLPQCESGLRITQRADGGTERGAAVGDRRSEVEGAEDKAVFDGERRRGRGGAGWEVLGEASEGASEVLGSDRGDEARRSGAIRGAEWASDVGEWDRGRTREWLRSKDAEARRGR